MPEHTTDILATKLKTLERRHHAFQALLVKAKELHAQLGELLVEQDELLGGGVGIGAKLRQFEIAWQAAWSSRYHGDYVFQYVKDRPAMKRLLKAFAPEDLHARIVNYIRSDDRFFLDRRHPFAVFVSTVNQHAPLTASAEGFTLEPVVDCRHSPRCTSDHEHTRRTRNELRA